MSSAAHDRRVGAIALGVIFLLLAAGLLVYRTAEVNAEAGQKADQFRVELAAPDLWTPTTEQVVRVLGDDGGALFE